MFVYKKRNKIEVVIYSEDLDDEYLQNVTVKDIIDSVEDTRFSIMTSSFASFITNHPKASIFKKRKTVKNEI